MARETVKTYDDLLDSVRAFNKMLEHGRRLREQIRSFSNLVLCTGIRRCRAW